MVRSPAATTRPSVRLRDGVPIRLLQLALFLLLVAFTAAIRPTAAQRPPLGRSKSIVQPRRNQVYVQLSAPPLAKAAANAGVDHVRAFSPDATHSNPVIAQAAQRIRLDKERFLEECKAANISVIVDSTFSTIANLISVRVSSPNHIDALRRLPGVLKVFPSLSGPLPKSSPVKSKPISIADARALFTTPQQQPRLRRRDGNDNPNLETTDWHVKSLHNMTRLTDAREADPSLTGKGIKVGVISSGIDWQHEAFVREGQSCEQWGDAGCRVTHGWACKVNQDAPPTDGGPVKPALEEGEDVGGLAPPPRRTPPLPPSFKTENVTCVSAEESAGEAIRDSCVGIGTSIASVVGGQWNGAVNGVAPEVTFGAYNIRPCTAASNESSAESFYYTTKLFLSILEHAIHDKMDVLMIEPTFRYGYHTQDTVESFVINAVSEWYNIPVVVPAGELRQEESKGTPHRIESPSHANGALTVTSVTSPVQPFDSINVTVGIPRGGGLPIRRRLRVLGALNPGSVRDDTPVFEKDRWYRLATSPHPPTVDDDGCPQGNHTWPASFFAGHIAVVRYAEKKCSLEQLFDAAGDARAVGVVFYTEYATLPREITTAWHSLRVPGLMLNKADGEWLRATVAANYNVTDPRDIPRARLRMNKRMWLRAAANVTVPAYNRWGPSMDLAIKPDLGCVGDTWWLRRRHL
ncbi:peptidase S8/S53 domain-containing protein [Catenaria anguillulae PL171]|uniref:Peptidase S8/S53 domain-containing protein n=1 Tax=Catenaria anguillulae PL171 TaxID=765915 RepID=A0A1Y2HAZ6_9FUNG|nr:peptidase S8/S53 domain-containing protein [Catenaria anguillulae PL171]